MRRRPTWSLRTYLLAAGVPWAEVKAMSPPELMERAKQMHEAA